MIEIERAAAEEQEVCMHSVINEFILYKCKALFVALFVLVTSNVVFYLYFWWWWCDSLRLLLLLS